MPRKQRELTMTVETTENTSKLLTEMLLNLLDKHPELARDADSEPSD